MRYRTEQKFNKIFQDWQDRGMDSVQMIRGLLEMILVQENEIEDLYNQVNEIDD